MGRKLTLAGAGLLALRLPPQRLLLLLEPSELVAVPGATGRRAILRPSDKRIKDLPRSPEEQTGPCGILDGGVDPSARLRWTLPDPSTLGKRQQRRKKPKPVLEITLDEGLQAPLPRPRVDLLLALPRPQQLAKMLPYLAQLGLGRLIVCGASKVNAGYFDSSTLEHKKLRSKMAEGLAYSGDTALPEVTVHRDLQCLLAEGGELDRMLPRASSFRLLAHPDGEGTSLLDVPRPEVTGTELPRPLLAVGPECGWDEDEGELELLESAGFRKVTAGQRVLRCDVAAYALVALAKELLADWEEDLAP